MYLALFFLLHFIKEMPDRRLPISHHLSLTFWVVACGRFNCSTKHFPPKRGTETRIFRLGQEKKNYIKRVYLTKKIFSYLKDINATANVMTLSRIIYGSNTPRFTFKTFPVT